MFTGLFYKGYNSRTAKWKRCIGQGMGSGGLLWSFSALSRFHPPSISMYSLTQKPSKSQCSGVFIEFNLQFPAPILEAGG